MIDSLGFVGAIRNPDIVITGRGAPRYPEMLAFPKPVSGWYVGNAEQEYKKKRKARKRVQERNKHRKHLKQIRKQSKRRNRK